jgi:hypothetical protein
MDSKKDLLVVLNFNQMSDYGLIYLINKQVLYLLGLFLARELETRKAMIL